MRNMKNLSALVVAFMLAALPFSFVITSGHAQTQAQTQAQDQTQDQAQSGALARGYRTGYSDGYAAGFQDAAQHASRNVQNKSEHRLVNRNYLLPHGLAVMFCDGS